MRTLVLGIWLVMALPTDAGDKMAIYVSPALSYAPSSLTIRLSITPDAENRALFVAAESGEFYRSSQVDLDGARAPKTSIFRYRSLPAGEYQVRSVLIGASGKERAVVARTVTILRSGVGDR